MLVKIPCYTDELNKFVEEKTQEYGFEHTEDALNKFLCEQHFWLNYLHELAVRLYEYSPNSFRTHSTSYPFDGFWDLEDDDLLEDAEGIIISSFERELIQRYLDSDKELV